VKRLQPNHAVFLENVGKQLRSAFSKRNIESIPVLGVIPFPNISEINRAISTGKPFTGLSVIFPLPYCTLRFWNSESTKKFRLLKSPMLVRFVLWIKTISLLVKARTLSCLLFKDSLNFPINDLLNPKT
jgi:hypothetical protein